MTYFPLLPIFLPLLTAPFIALLGTQTQGAWANLILTAITLLLTLATFASPGAGLIHADSLGLLFGALTAFIALTTAIANLTYIQHDTLSPRRWRVYHAMCLTLLGSTLLGLYADNIGLLWAAVEGATIAATLGVSLPRTASALEAAWKYFILAGCGIALALFGTMLLYLAAQPALGPGLSALSFTALSSHGAALNGPLMTLSFTFLLFGYGTKAALAPLHGWLPDAYAEGPAPLTTALSGLTLNLALISLLRFSHLMRQAHANGALSPSPFLLTLGLASILLTAFSLSRRRDSRRFFGFSSIEHSGIAIFAFGIGGAAAIFGGLLHMALHTLIKSALFQTLIRAAAARGSTAPGAYGFSHLRGLLHTNKLLGWTLGLAIFALCGLPPSGLFASEFIIIAQTVQRAPYLSLPLGLGLLLCAIAIIRNIGPLIFDPAPKSAKPAATSATMLLPAVHLLLAFLLAFLMPLSLFHLLTQISAGLQ